MRFATIQLATYTEAEWTAWNGILLKGQHAYSSDVLYSGTNQMRFKVGNGIDTWTALDYVPESSSTATEGITAHAGGGQGSATALSSSFNIVSTVATTGDSCKLDAATVGKVREVANFGANDLDLFPASGEFLKNYTTVPTVNAAVSIAPGNSIRFVCYTAGTWQYM